MTRVFDELAERNFLRDLHNAAFAEGAAYILSEINAGRPFREGNGRTQLAFLKLLCVGSGHDFDDDALNPDLTLRAMAASSRGDLAPLTALIADLMTEFASRARRAYIGLAGNGYGDKRLA